MISVAPKLGLGSLMSEHLELPRPLRLLATIAWSLTESAGLPVAAYAGAAWLGGRDAGLLAALAATWATVAIRKLATRCVPSLMTISAVVVVKLAAPQAQLPQRPVNDVPSSITVVACPSKMRAAVALTAMSRLTAALTVTRVTAPIIRRSRSRRCR
jgi:hypothetical protein